MKRALRIVYKDEPNDKHSFQDRIDKDGAVKMHGRNLQRFAVQMYKVKNNISPLPMQELFNKQAQVYNTSPFPMQELFNKQAQVYNISPLPHCLCKNFSINKPRYIIPIAYARTFQ